MKYLSLIISILCLLIGIITLLNPITLTGDSLKNTDSFLLFLISSILFIGFLIAHYLDKLKEHIIANKEISNSNITTSTSTEKWKCPKCSRFNDASVFECENCGFKLK